MFFMVKIPESSWSVLPIKKKHVATAPEKHSNPPVFAQLQQLQLDPQVSPTMGAGTMYSQADLGIRLAPEKNGHSYGK